MPNLPLAFAELLVGAIVIDAAVKGAKLSDVVKGQAQQASISGLGGDTGAGSVGAIAGAGNPPTAASLAGATPGQIAKVTGMLTMANTLNGKPYIWGGGHSSSWAVQAGYDCSGFISAVLHAGGYLSSPQTTQTLPGQPGILSGPGRFVTIYDRTNGGSPGNDHVIADIAGQWWESGGQAGLGVHQIGKPADSYLATFDRLLHPQGL